MTYLLLASLSSLVSAGAEGRLLDVQEAALPSGGLTKVNPYIYNISTIVDFAVLNPLAIYFFSISANQRRLAHGFSKLSRKVPHYHRFGLVILSAILATYTMNLYVGNFSTYFDATMIPDGNGGSTITVTGWIVFSWTTLFIFVIIVSCFEQGVFVISILKLSPNDIPYNPLHYDEVARVKFIIAPAVSFMYAMMTMLAIYIVFAIHDDLIFHIEESNRLWSLTLYVSAGIPLFAVPFFHLHRLMNKNREHYLREIACTAGSVLARPFSYDVLRKRSDMEDVATFMEKIDKYKKLVYTFPTWPLPVRISAPPLGSLIAAVLPLIKELANATILKSAIPFP